MSVDKVVAGWVRRRLRGYLAELLISTCTVCMYIPYRLTYPPTLTKHAKGINDKITWQGSSTNLEGLDLLLRILFNSRTPQYLNGFKW